MRKTIVSTQILGRMTYEIADMLNACSQGKTRSSVVGRTYLLKLQDALINLDSLEMLRFNL